MIQSEEGVAKGVRRIVAITGQKAAEDSLLRVRSLQPKLEDAKKLKGKEQEQEVARPTRVSSAQHAILSATFYSDQSTNTTSLRSLGGF